MDLLHAHRVSPKLLRNRRLNLFAIRICSLCSLHPSANPPNSLFTLLATIVTKLKSGRKTYRFLIRERRGCLESLALNGNSAFCFLDFVQSQNCFSLCSLLARTQKKVLASAVSLAQKKEGINTFFLKWRERRGSNSRPLA